VRLTVLSVAYPLAPVAPSVSGGAEQVLLQLDRALQQAGHRSLVIACPGSQISGELIESRPVAAVIDDSAQNEARRAHADLIRQVLAAEPVDVVHMHGVDYHFYLPDAGPAVLVTLHLPLNFYPAEALAATRPRTWLHCVSQAQHATRPNHACFLAPIENGVEIPTVTWRKDGAYCLFLGRICPEKGVRVAIDAAKLAHLPIVIAGTIFPYPDHTDYFSKQIKPQLDENCRFISSASPETRLELLQNARCLLVPSLIEETSSLVSREALAAGTPVVAFRRAALAELIENGRTGFLVDSAEEMANAIDSCRDIDGHVCQEFARRDFPLEKMTGEYLRLYEQIASGGIS
jgi:hypothetical protein